MSPLHWRRGGRFEFPFTVYDVKADVELLFMTGGPGVGMRVGYPLWVLSDLSPSLTLFNAEPVSVPTVHPTIDASPATCPSHVVARLQRRRLGSQHRRTVAAPSSNLATPSHRLAAPSLLASIGRRRSAVSLPASNAVAK
ncbi:hypothetical protein PIB30_052800 [Stylosanthes scabra]|nr:hypothetical protein [Stylosanthes scabra]